MPKNLKFLYKTISNSYNFFISCDYVLVLHFCNY